MPALTKTQLKALWINGFIPDQDDYIDFFDSFKSELDLSSPPGDTQKQGNFTPTMPSNFSIGSAIGKWSSIGTQITVSVSLFGVTGNTNLNGVIIQNLPQITDTANLYIANGVVTPLGGNNPSKEVVMYVNGTNVTVFDSAVGTIMTATDLQNANIRFSVTYNYAEFT